MTLDIEARKVRLDQAARRRQDDRPVWFGETGDTCPRCHVAVPAGFMLALPHSDTAGCLRCLERDAHWHYGGLQNMPGDLVGVVGQEDALRRVAEGFRQWIRAARKGREPPRKSASAERWHAMDEEVNERRDDSSREPSAQAQHPPRPGLTANRDRVAEARQRLGLVGPITRAFVIAAFRQAALKCHPDHGGNEAAFRSLVEAREFLLSKTCDGSRG